MLYNPGMTAVPFLIIGALAVLWFGLEYAAADQLLNTVIFGFAALLGAWALSILVDKAW
jgi:hypothetical protein